MVGGDWQNPNLGWWRRRYPVALEQSCKTAAGPWVSAAETLAAARWQRRNPN
ncbi:hypothetical protein Hanom_Chr15g01414771 [Helianthus anomalus]